MTFLIFFTTSHGYTITTVTVAPRFINWDHQSDAATSKWPTISHSNAPRHHRQAALEQECSLHVCDGSFQPWMSVKAVLRAPCYLFCLTWEGGHRHSSPPPWTGTVLSSYRVTLGAWPVTNRTYREAETFSKAVPVLRLHPGRKRGLFYV